MRAVISTVMFLLTGSLLYSQSSNEVMVIRAQVQAINNVKGYKIKTLTNDYFVNEKNEVTDNGQELKGYYKDGKLKKLSYYAGLSNCVKTYEYYLDDAGRLIFVFEKEKDFPGLKDGTGLDYSKLVPAFEGRYYFDQGKLIKIKIHGKERSADENKTAFQEFLEDFKKDLKTQK
ncbi:MAG TPA: hypothetical protein VG367_10655 [Mucilaginibacter sp.]|nr:hypothetical protein [Mucilaginibacter sp.]